MPVYQINEEMPHDELLMWARFFEARPVGWREDSRTSVIVQAQGAKVKGDQIFPSLAQLKKWEAYKSDADRSNETLRSSVFGAKLSASFKKIDAKKTK